MDAQVEQVVRGGQLRFRLVQGLARDRMYYSRKHGWTGDASNASLFVSVATAERSLSEYGLDPEVCLQPVESPWRV
jgi:hypothetical protein